MDRALDCGSKGCGFESRRAHMQKHEFNIPYSYELRDCVDNVVPISENYLNSNSFRLLRVAHFRSIKMTIDGGEFTRDEILNLLKIRSRQPVDIFQPYKRNY